MYFFEKTTVQVPSIMPVSRMAAEKMSCRKRKGGLASSFSVRGGFRTNRPSDSWVRWITSGLTAAAMPPSPYTPSQSPGFHLTCPAGFHFFHFNCFLASLSRASFLNAVLSEKEDIHIFLTNVSFGRIRGI